MRHQMIIKLQTSDEEVYQKLPKIQIQKEIEFNNNSILKYHVNKLNRSGWDLELIPKGDKIILRNKSPGLGKQFDIYRLTHAKYR